MALRLGDGMNTRVTIITEFLISALISVVGVFLIPKSIEGYYTVMSQGEAMIPILVSLLCILASLLLTAFLRVHLNKRTFISSLGRVIGFVFILLSCITVFSFLSGFFSVAVYRALKMTLSLAQIKGIINYTVTVALALLLPVFVSVFWSILKGNGTFLEDLKSGLTLKNYRYVKLLGLLLAMFGIGILLSILFYYIPSVLLAYALKMLLLSVLGTALLHYSETITDVRRI